ncbi:MAG: glutaredoxin family protein [Polyangiales bacterium]
MTKHGRAVFCLGVAIVIAFPGCSDRKVGVDGNAKATAIPFELRDDSSSILLTFVDENGAHVVEHVTDVPEPSRNLVRVQKLDSDHRWDVDENEIWVANLAAKTEQGGYALKRMARSDFDREIDRRQGVNREVHTDATNSASRAVTIYGASWCGACRATAEFFRAQGIEFVEKDIEKDAAAKREMIDKAARAGVRTNGIPVIDFDGSIINGFDEGRLRALISQQKRESDSKSKG